jgi:hypothetical protein
MHPPGPVTFRIIAYALRPRTEDDWIEYLSRQSNWPPIGTSISIQGGS